MKRPFALVGFTYLLTQAVSVFLGGKGAFFLSLFCLLAGLFLLCLRAWRREPLLVLPVAFLAAAVASGAFVAGNAPLEKAAQTNGGRTVELIGMVCELPSFDGGKTHYTVEVEACTGDSSLIGLRVQLTSGETFAAELFDRIQGTVKLYKPAGNGFFSRRSQLLADRVILQGFFNEYEPYAVRAAEVPAWEKVPYQLRTAMEQAIETHLNTPQSALARGLLLGGSDGISTEVQDAFRDAGVYHLLSVSGVHMAAVAQFLLVLLSVMPIPRRLRYVLACAGVLLFMAVANFVPSVLRSGLMYLLLLAGHLFSRRADSINSLGLAALLLCAFNPYEAADIGFLLSFSATFGILLCMPPFTRVLQRYQPRLPIFRSIWTLVCGTVATSVVATIFTLPLCLLVFDTTSLVSVVSNLLVLLPSTWLLYALLLAACFTVVPIPFLAACCWQGADLLARGLLFVTRLCANLPFATIETHYRFITLWIACALLLFGIACLIGWRRGKAPLRTAALLSVILLLVNILGYEVQARDACRVTVAASGEAVSAVLSYRGHSVVIGCGAGAWQVNRILRRVQTKSLDTVVLLTQDTQESQAAAELLKQWRPRQIVLHAGLALDIYLEQALSNAGQVVLCGTTAQSALWDDTALLTYADRSALLSVNGVKILFNGQKADLSYVPSVFQSADILVGPDLPKNPGSLSPRLTCLSIYPNSLDTYDAAQFGAPVVLGNGEDLVLESQTSGQLEIRRND